MPTGFEKRLWNRVAVIFAAVALILMVGKFLPLPGTAVAEMMEACRTGSTGPIGLFHVMYACPGPMLPHKELLMPPLLGSVAVFALFAIWLRRRLTNEQD
jgi:hypothetical protein